MYTKVIDYFKSSYEELKKVAWPSRDETVKKTLLVILISLGVALFIGVLDFLLNALLEVIV